MKKSIQIFIKPALFVLFLSLFSCYSNVEKYFGTYKGVLNKDYNVGGPTYSNTSVIVDAGSQSQSVKILCGDFLFIKGSVVIDNGIGNGTFRTYNDTPVEVEVEFKADSLIFFANYNIGGSSGYYIYFNGKK